jgi:conjugal transfer/entry exclusion protein
MKFILFIISFVFCVKSIAFVVFDPSNFVKNSLTATQTAQQIEYLISQYQTQLAQYRTELLQIKSIDSELTNELLDKNSIDSASMTQVTSSLKNLFGSINTISNNFNQRLDAAKLLSLTWPQYIAFEQNRIQRNEGNAANTAIDDLQILDRVQRDYQFALDAESKIPFTEGLHQSLQLLNTQLNRIITQNADMIKSINNATTSKNGILELSDKALKDQVELNSAMIKNSLNYYRFNGEKTMATKLGSNYFAN